MNSRDDSRNPQQQEGSSMYRVLSSENIIIHKHLARPCGAALCCITAGMNSRDY